MLEIEKALQTHPFLVVAADGSAELTTTPPQTDEPVLVMHLGRAVARFGQITDQSIFTFAEMQQIGKLSSSTLRDWQDLHLIRELPQRGATQGRPRLFGRQDAVTCATLGALRRQRQPVSALRAVADLVRDPFRHVTVSH